MIAHQTMPNATDSPLHMGDREASRSKAKGELA